MREIRPSTWVMLGVLVLIIFGPLFLLNIAPIQDLEPASNEPHPAGNGIHPANPRTNTDKPANRPADNRPPANRESSGERKPPINEPEDGLVD